MCANGVASEGTGRGEVASPLSCFKDSKVSTYTNTYNMYYIPNFLPGMYFKINSSQ
jgi:hypothetical protein